MNICFVSSEFVPFAKTGGLADVSAALCAYLADSGHDVRAFVPLYSRINAGPKDFTALPALRGLRLKLGAHEFEYSVFQATSPETGLPVYFVHCPALYKRPSIYTNDGDEHLRFLLLSRAALESCQRMGFAPDIVHCNDWQTGFIPLFLRTLYGWDKLFENTRTVMTIHNIGYQGVFGSHILGDTDIGDSAHLLHQDDMSAGRIGFLQTGLLYADAITTVSPTYAQEILSDDFGMGLQYTLRDRRDTLVGILNGVDYEVWSPERDTFIPHNYSSADVERKALNKQALLEGLHLDYHPRRPAIGLVTRLTGQKGLDLIADVLPGLLAHRDMSFVALGSGEHHYEEFFTDLQRHFPDRVCFYRGFNNALAHLIEAGCDMFLMPSLFEPCGLNQMYSLKYGTLPIVRQTGGLADSVHQYDPATGEGTGVVFRDYNADALSWALNFALDLYDDEPSWQRAMANAMRQDYSWERQGSLYVELYRRLIQG